ncbi:AAA family ATPase [Micromonospora harpali]|uniref:AAA family ATPase n=1 Tax=Micromonospora harpali TaxID=1490225 RepID=A0ABW1HGV0_9ACTN
MVTDEGTGSIFEERAENLTRGQLESWTTLSSRESKVVAKLKGTGAKLLIGPRGSGKSTLMLLAYYQLLDNNEVLPVYVNYAKHLAVEPIFKTRPDATELFRQWVLAKVVLGLHETEISALSPSEDEWVDLVASSREFVEDLEIGTVPDGAARMSPTRLISHINRCIAAAGRKRAVLFFDDAAHAFSAQQQREFFEIYRQLRTRTIAPKAAVYPGVTNYSANMHIGHDAEVLEAWYRADDPAFVESMQDVLSRRLPVQMRAEFDGDRAELLHYLALASFGLPRNFLTMIQEVLDFDEDEGSHKSPSRRHADLAVERNVAIVRSVFESTGDKIPRYLNLIAEGRRLEDAFLNHISRSNSTKPVGQKVVAVGVKRPIPKEFQQVLDLMAYAGIIRKLDSQSRGSAGVFERYEMHSGFIISSNAFSLGRNPSTRDIVTCFLRRPTAGIVRGRPEAWLGEDYRSRCTLNLTACSNCGAPRVSEDAQFCMKCGRPLSDKSIYHEILQRPLTDLPIPEKKKKALKNTNLSSVQDVLLDVEFKELLRGHYIGAKWAKKIFSAAEEYVSV